MPTSPRLSEEGVALNQPHPGINAAPRCWQFHVPIDAAALSHNRRVHHYARSKMTRQVRAEVELAWQQAGRPTAQRRVRLDFTTYRGRRLDIGTILDGVKAFVDGLCGKRYSKHPITRKRIVEPGLLTPDDNDRWVDYGKVSQVIGPAFTRRPSLLITATEDPEGAPRAAQRQSTQQPRRR